MQKHALTLSGKTIFAFFAKKKTTYFCPSCHAPMHVRSGPLRTPHFYHITNACSASSPTSQEHIQVQQIIAKTMKRYEATIEKHFSLIGRTADVALASKQLIFEVQCSKISKQEVKRRNREYGELGYTVIWILHDQTFNRTTLSSAERYLLTWPHYYTNIDQEGKGIIYDQFILYEGNRVIYKGRRFAVDLSRWTKELYGKPIGGELGYQLRMRQKRWKLSFGGDLYQMATKERGNRARSWRHKVKKFLLRLGKEAQGVRSARRR